MGAAAAVAHALDRAAELVRAPYPAGLGTPECRKSNCGACGWMNKCRSFTADEIAAWQRQSSQSFSPPGGTCVVVGGWSPLSLTAGPMLETADTILRVDALAGGEADEALLRKVRGAKVLRLRHELKPGVARGGETLLHYCPAVDGRVPVCWKDLEREPAGAVAAPRRSPLLWERARVAMGLRMAPSVDAIAVVAALAMCTSVEVHGLGHDGESSRTLTHSGTADAQREWAWLAAQEGAGRLRWVRAPEERWSYLPVVAAWKKERGEKCSQGEQDTRIARLLREMGAPDGAGATYVEFGFNGDSGSNTVALRERGWRGHLFDCCLGPDPKINLHKAWLSVATIAELFRSHGVPTDLTYLSVDIDASDIWLLRALLRGGFKPSLVTIEYNSNFPADAPLAFPDPDADPKDAYPVGWDGGCYMGSSFAAIEAVAREEGYVIVDVEPGYDLFLARADAWGARPVLRGAELERRAYAPFNLPADRGTVWGARKMGAYLE